jgi:DNA-binding MarR family transcriptional regulator
MATSQPQLGYLLKNAQSLLHLRMEEALRPLQLTVSQYSCLHHLREQPGISAAALARATFVTRQSMNAMLQQLIDRGLVSRPARVESGRALPSQLTPHGNEALDSAQARVTAVEQRMLGGLTPATTTALAHALTACIAALEQ